MTLRYHYAFFDSNEANTQPRAAEPCLGTVPCKPRLISGSAARIGSRGMQALRLSCKAGQ